MQPRRHAAYGSGAGMSAQRILQAVGLLVALLLLVPVATIAYFFVGAGNCQSVKTPPQLPAAASDPALPTRTIQANGLTFAYIEAGQGPLVLLLHGFPENAHSWQALMPALASANYHAVAVFMRGYYPTDIPPNGDYSVETMAVDVLALMDGFGEHSAVVIGHDWGASVAMATANLAPERVDKLVGIPHPRVIAVSPRVLSCLPHFIVLQFGALSEWWAARDDFAYIKQLYAYWSPELQLSPSQLQEIETDFRRPGRLAAAIAYYHFGSADQGDPRRTELYNRIIRVPTLALAGNDDVLWQLGLFENSASAFSGPFRLVPVEHAGHFLQLEQPRVIQDQILQFLANTSARLGGHRSDLADGRGRAPCVRLKCFAEPAQAEPQADLRDAGQDRVEAN
jgi:pimeloyl-ACP methyl ester carboxylesterase